MTNPVIMTGAQPGDQAMSFVLPAETSAAGAPDPTVDGVEIKTLESGLFAVLRFDGKRDEAMAATALETLRGELAADGIEPAGPPRFAYYDPPWIPSALRRNEVMLPVVVPPASQG